MKYFKQILIICLFAGLWSCKKEVPENVKTYDVVFSVSNGDGVDYRINGHDADSGYNKCLLGDRLELKTYKPSQFYGAWIYVNGEAVCSSVGEGLDLSYVIK